MSELPGVETIRSKSGETLAVVVRTAARPEKTTFITPPERTQQAGFIVYGAGQACPDHAHRPVERHIHETAETLLVRQGRMVARIYDRERLLVAEPVLETGDIILLVAGAHGFQMLEHTVLFEIKQGPYGGVDEKVRL